MAGEDDTPHMKCELDGELKRYLNEMNDYIPEARSHKFYQSLLSPVRDQGETGTCAFVVSITCLEMMRRLTYVLDREDYFDLHDVFDHLFALKRDHLRWSDINGNMYVAKVFEILQFAKKYGLLMDSECRNSNTRNMHVSFHREATRTRLTSFKFLLGSEFDEGIEAVKESPIIAGLRAYESLGSCNKVYYNGPSQTDIEHIKEAKKKDSITSHFVVAVGYITLKVGSNFLISQNSYGEEAHYKGFAVIPLDEKIFTKIWLPWGLKKNKGGLKKKVGMTALVVSSMIFSGMIVRAFRKPST